MAASEQAAADGGIWDIAFPLMGVPPPPKEMRKRQDHQGEIGEEEPFARLADPLHVTAVLQYLGDTAALKKRREDARRKRWGRPEDDNKETAAAGKKKGSGKGEFWKAWKAEQARKAEEEEEGG